ncbi:MAG: response regulator transcription factor [Brachymonas sp.]
MSRPHQIVLVGFSSFEKVTFESFFRLAARRPPGYVLVDDPAHAHLAVVNADDPAVLRQCMATKPAAKVLLIGSQDGGTGWVLQRRPLNLMKVLSTVESLLSPPAATVPAELAGFRPAQAADSAQAAKAAQAIRPPASTTTASPVATPAPTARISTPLHENRAARATQQMPTGAPEASHDAVDSTLRRSVRTGVGQRVDSVRPTDLGAFTHSTLGKPPASAHGSDSAMDVDHILVVDDSDIALKFMRNRLSRFGFLADLVNSGEEALGRMNTKPYKFVFLDVMMEGLDGYQTCRAIKQRKYSDGKPPVVVMLTSRGGTIDKIRGTLAGCDAYLTKPLNERDLIAVLAKHDRNVARGFQETNFGASGGQGFSRSTK